MIMLDINNEKKLPFHEMNTESQDMLRTLHENGQVEQFCPMKQIWMEPMTPSDSWWNGIYRIKQEKEG